KLSSWLSAEDYKALSEVAARDIAERVMQQRFGMLGFDFRGSSFCKLSSTGIVSLKKEFIASRKSCLNSDQII
ncbi:MAG: hypothetical protein AAFS06_23375, partial [Cyanobacteria bacterium J06631_12]